VEINDTSSKCNGICIIALTSPAISRLNRTRFLVEHKVSPATRSFSFQRRQTVKSLQTQTQPQTPQTPTDPNRIQLISPLPLPTSKPKPSSPTIKPDLFSMSLWDKFQFLQNECGAQDNFYRYRETVNSPRFQTTEPKSPKDKLSLSGSESNSKLSNSFNRRLNMEGAKRPVLTSTELIIPYMGLLTHDLLLMERDTGDDMSTDDLRVDWKRYSDLGNLILDVRRFQDRW
jgi:hypothetical protein